MHLTTKKSYSLRIKNTSCGSWGTKWWLAWKLF